MIRVSAISDFEQFELIDKHGVKRKLKMFEKNGNIYIGPVQALFDRTHICKDKNRMDFTSKLDKRFNELLHVSSIIEKINKHKTYSYFTKDIILEFLYSKGYTEEDIILKNKTYTCARENFIEYGFNSMNFCLDRREDLWVHYKEYEEQKQYREIIKNIPKEKLSDFENEYKKMVRFIRYANIDNEGNVKGFALKSINISKLYRWLSDNYLIHKINYVSDIYNEVTRELEFTDITVENTFVKVIATPDGLILKQQPAVETI